jgi:molybdenum cofactor cytidylyltransferase
MTETVPPGCATVKTPTAGIILAAGESKRFGEPKQLLRLGGRRLMEWVLQAALESSLDIVVLVLGCEHDRIQRGLLKWTAHPKCTVLVNPHYREGLSTSLKAGLAGVAHDFPSAMFLLGDQPMVTAALIDLLLRRFAQSEKSICVPAHRGTRGNPVLFASSHYPAILRLSGDTGARDLITAHPEQVLAVEVPDPRIFLDIDRREDAEMVATVLESRLNPKIKPVS